MAVGHRDSALAAQVLTAAPGMIQDVACDAAAAAAAVPVVLAEAASAAAAAEAAAVIGSGAETAAVLRQHRYAPDMEQNAAGDAVQLAGTGAFHTALGHAAAAAAAAAAAGDAAAASADDDAAAAAVAAAVPGAGEAKGRRHKHVHSHQEVQILALQRHCPVQLGCLAPQAAVMVEGGSLA